MGSLRTTAQRPPAHPRSHTPRTSSRTRIRLASISYMGRRPRLRRSICEGGKEDFVRWRASMQVQVRGSVLTWRGCLRGKQQHLESIGQVYDDETFLVSIVLLGAKRVPCQRIH